MCNCLSIGRRVSLKKQSSCCKKVAICVAVVLEVGTAPVSLIGQNFQELVAICFLRQHIKNLHGNELGRAAGWEKF